MLDYKASVSPRLSICIVNWNTGEYLYRLLSSIWSTIRDFSAEVIVIDNASTEQLDLMGFEDTCLIKNNENIGFAAGVNQAIQFARGKYILLLNPDVLMLPNSINEMLKFLDEHDNVGAVGGLCLNADHSTGPSYGCFPRLKVFIVEAFLGRFGLNRIPNLQLAIIPKEDNRDPIKVEYIIGACFLVKRQVINSIGFMDERFFAFFEETDWCYRMELMGWDRYIVPKARVIHYGGKSFDQVPEEKIRFFYQSLYLFINKYRGRLVALLFRDLIMLIQYRRYLVSRFIEILKPKGDNYIKEARYELAVIRAHQSIKI